MTIKQGSIFSDRNDFPVVEIDVHRDYGQWEPFPEFYPPLVPPEGPGPGTQHSSNPRDIVQKFPSDSEIRVVNRLLEERAASFVRRDTQCTYFPPGFGASTSIFHILSKLQS